MNSAKKDALRQLAEPVPLVIRNAPTSLMAELNYGKGYQYAHDTQEKLTNMQCLPDSLLGREYYVPTEQGVEGRVQGAPCSRSSSGNRSTKRLNRGNKRREKLIADIHMHRLR